MPKPGTARERKEKAAKAADFSENKHYKDDAGAPAARKPDLKPEKGDDAHEHTDDLSGWKGKTCDLCGEASDATKDELYILDCTFEREDCPEKCAYHFACVAEYLRKNGYRTDRHVGFPCPRGTETKHSAFGRPCSGKICGAHMVRVRNDEKKKKHIKAIEEASAAIKTKPTPAPPGAPRPKPSGGGAEAAAAAAAAKEAKLAEMRQRLEAARRDVMARTAAAAAAAAAAARGRPVVHGYDAPVTSEAPGGGAWIKVGGRPGMVTSSSASVFSHEGESSGGTTPRGCAHVFDTHTTAFHPGGHGGSWEPPAPLHAAPARPPSARPSGSETPSESDTGEWTTIAGGGTKGAGSTKAAHAGGTNGAFVVGGAPVGAKFVSDAAKKNAKKNERLKAERAAARAAIESVAAASAAEVAAASAARKAALASTSTPRARAIAALVDRKRGRLARELASLGFPPRACEAAVLVFGADVQRAAGWLADGGGMGGGIVAPDAPAADIDISDETKALDSLVTILAGIVPALDVLAAVADSGGDVDAAAVSLFDCPAAVAALGGGVDGQESPGDDAEEWEQWEVTEEPAPAEADAPAHAHASAFAPVPVPAFVSLPAHALPASVDWRGATWGQVPAAAALPLPHGPPTPAVYVPPNKRGVAPAPESVMVWAPAPAPTLADGPRWRPESLPMPTAPAAAPLYPWLTQPSGGATAACGYKQQHHDSPPSVLPSPEELELAELMAGLMGN